MVVRSSYWLKVRFLLVDHRNSDVITLLALPQDWIYPSEGVESLVWVPSELCTSSRLSSFCFLLVVASRRLCSGLFCESEYLSEDNQVLIKALCCCSAACLHGRLKLLQCPTTGKVGHLMSECSPINIPQCNYISNNILASIFVCFSFQERCWFKALFPKGAAGLRQGKKMRIRVEFRLGFTQENPCLLPLKRGTETTFPQ